MRDADGKSKEGVRIGTWVQPYDGNPPWLAEIDRVTE